MENDEAQREQARQERSAELATAMRRSKREEKTRHLAGAIVAVTIGGFIAAACGSTEGVRGVAFVAVAAIAGIALLGRRDE